MYVHAKYLLGIPSAAVTLAVILTRQISKQVLFPSYVFSLQDFAGAHRFYAWAQISCAHIRGFLTEEAPSSQLFS